MSFQLKEVQYADEMPGFIEYLGDKLKYGTTFGVDGYSEDLEVIECRSRDGFIPHGHNRGGIRFKQFADLMSVFGSGCYPTDLVAKKTLDRAIDNGINDAADAFIEKYAGELMDLGAPEHCNDLPSSLQNEYSDYEQAHLGQDNSVFYYTQAKYEGSENGVHTLYLTACINWEAPYHRSSVAWMPGLVCESDKSVEIKFKSVEELDKKLDAALKSFNENFF